VLERERERGIAMGGVVVEDAGVYVGTGGSRDLHGVVGGVRVEDVDIVRPRHRGERCRQVVLLVLREDED
jgi:hypothetical protein